MQSTQKHQLSPVLAVNLFPDFLLYAVLKDLIPYPQMAVCVPIQSAVLSLPATGQAKFFVHLVDLPAQMPHSLSFAITNPLGYVHLLNDIPECFAYSEGLVESGHLPPVRPEAECTDKN